MKVLKGSAKGVLIRAFKRDCCNWLHKYTYARFSRRRYRVKQLIKIAKRLFPESFSSGAGSRG